MSLTPQISSKDHLRGALSAPVHLVEFGDFECPYCGQAFLIVEAIERVLGDRLCFAFRNFPLAEVHPDARIAAEAAEAAGAQDRFWQMHHLLYTHQDALDVPSLFEYASTLDLDMEQFESDLRSHRFEPRLRTDLHSGAVSGVNGTPTFFINGHRHDGSYDLDTLMQAITGRGAAIEP